MSIRSDTPYSVENRSTANDRCEIVCPKLSGDRLISVAQFNLIRGFTTNALILDILRLLLPVDCKPSSGDVPLFPSTYLKASGSQTTKGEK